MQSSRNLAHYRLDSLFPLRSRQRAYSSATIGHKFHPLGSNAPKKPLTLLFDVLLCMRNERVTIARKAQQPRESMFSAFLLASCGDGGMQKCPLSRLCSRWGVRILKRPLGISVRDCRGVWFPWTLREGNDQQRTHNVRSECQVAGTVHGSMLLHESIHRLEGSTRRIQLRVMRIVEDTLVVQIALSITSMTYALTSVLSACDAYANFMSR